jgi:hypothetical protein
VKYRIFDRQMQCSGTLARNLELSTYGEYLVPLDDS